MNAADKVGESQGETLLARIERAERARMALHAELANECERDDEGEASA